MTKKHFKLLADELKATKPLVGQSSMEELYETSIYQWHKDVQAIIKVCAISNPGFDRERFLSACGYIVEDTK